mgnify:CR=1 FL=1
MDKPRFQPPHVLTLQKPWQPTEMEISCSNEATDMGEWADLQQHKLSVILVAIKDPQEVLKSKT